MSHKIIDGILSIGSQRLCVNYIARICNRLLACMLCATVTSCAATKEGNQLHLSEVILQGVSEHRQIDYQGIAEFVEAMAPVPRVEELGQLGIRRIPREIIDRLFSILVDRAEGRSDYVMVGDIIEAKYGRGGSYNSAIWLDPTANDSQKRELIRKFRSQSQEQLNRAKEFYLRAGDFLGASVAGWEIAWLYYGEKDYKTAIEQIDEAIILYKKGRENPKRDPDLGMTIAVRLTYHGVLSRLENDKHAFESAKASENP